MHLKSLTIKNFRLLEDVEVKKLGHVNLIVGKNNSGKSTVLEALALLASGFYPKVVRKINNCRDVNKEALSIQMKSGWTTSFSIRNMFNSNDSPFENIYIGNDDYSIHFGYQINDLDKVFDGYYGWVFTDDVVNSKVEIRSNVELNSLKEEKFGFKNSSHYNYEYIETIGIVIDELASDWDDIILTEAEDTALDMLRLIEPDILDLAFLDRNNNRVPYVRLANSKRRTPLNEMGDGIFRLLQIILKVLKAKDGFLLIDEFENGLHYSVQPEVWRLIFELAKRFNTQVFATTHSWDCIESFAKVAKEREDLDGVLFRMGRSARKSDKGKVITTEFDEDELYNLTKDNIEVR